MLNSHNTYYTITKTIQLRNKMDRIEADHPNRESIESDRFSLYFFFRVQFPRIL